MDLLRPTEMQRPVEAEGNLRRRGVGEVQLTLSDVVEAVMECAANSHEAAAVIEDLLATKRVRLISKTPPAEVSLCSPARMKGMSA